LDKSEPNINLKEKVILVPGMYGVELQADFLNSTPKGSHTTPHIVRLVREASTIQQVVNFIE
jgi:hypothetical protein